MTLMAAGATPITADFPQLNIVMISQLQCQPRYRDKLFLTQKYLEERLSIAQIARLTFSSKPAVRDALIEQGIELRRPRWHHGHPSQPRYGTKVRNGREEPHKGEQLVVARIHDLRAQGKSLRRIAHLLDQDGTLTKCRGKKWHPEMVSRILASAG